MGEVERKEELQLTGSKEVIDDPNDLAIRHLDIGVLVKLPVLAVVDERVGDVPNIVLKVNQLDNSDQHSENIFCFVGDIVHNHPV